MIRPKVEDAVPTTMTAVGVTPPVNDPWAGEARAEQTVESPRMAPATRDCGRSAAEIEFLKAIQDYKRSSGRMFPTWSEVLEVIQDLGYQKPSQDRPVSSRQVRTR